MSKMKKKERLGSDVHSYRLSKRMLGVLDALVDPKLEFPLKKPMKPTSRVKWFEVSMAWLLASALRKEICQEQVDSCLQPNDVFDLWLAFVKARNKQKGYSFTSDDKEIRKVLGPEDSIIRRAGWGS